MSEKIEPVLSAEEWAAFRHHDGYTLYDAQFAGTLRLTTDDGYSLEVRSPDAMIAFANATLHDDDPRKITRERIELLRMNLAKPDSGVGLVYRQISLDFLDALESYLRPEA